MRILVCGGRDYSDELRVTIELNLLAEIHKKLIIIQGGARGADRLAHQWALRNGYTSITVKAEWDKYRKRAGPLRNQKMLDQYNINKVIAFPGGRGTADMVSRAQAACIPVVQILGA